VGAEMQVERCKMNGTEQNMRSAEELRAWSLDTVRGKKGTETIVSYALYPPLQMYTENNPL
jgi:hypothetical protein